MAQNVTVQGASYSAVPSVVLPKTGGGSASFFDVSDTTAAAADVASGKYFYTSAGVKTAGTASGGSSFTKIGSTTELTVSTTSTTAASAGTIELGSAYYTSSKIIYVRVRDKAGKRAGYFYGADAYFMNVYNINGATTTMTVPAQVSYRYSTNNTYGIVSGGYGVYAYSINSTGTLTIRKRYNSTNSLTVDGTYTIDVYAVDPPLTLFG